MLQNKFVILLLLPSAKDRFEYTVHLNLSQLFISDNFSVNEKKYPELLMIQLRLTLF